MLTSSTASTNQQGMKAEGCRRLACSGVDSVQGHCCRLWASASLYEVSRKQGRQGPGTQNTDSAGRLNADLLKLR